MVSRELNCHKSDSHNNEATTESNYSQPKCSRANISDNDNIIVSYQNQPEASPHTQEELLRAIIDSVDGGIMVVAENGDIIHSNSYLLELWNLPYSAITNNNNAEPLELISQQLINPDSFNSKFKQLCGTIDKELFFINLIDGRVFECSTHPLRALSHTKFRIWSFRDTATIKHHESPIAQAKQHTKTTAKWDFLAGMNHELLTPLNAIIGFSQLLESDTQLDSLHHKDITEIHKAGKHLLELINYVMDLAKFESGRIQLTQESVSLRELLFECQWPVNHQAEKYNTALSIDHETGAHYVTLADRTRLKQVLINLISITLKYSHEQGLVDVQCKAIDNKYVKIIVRDTVTANSSVLQEKISSAFNHTADHKLSIDDTSIALYVGKILIEKMGGKIGFEIYPKCGNEFWIKLPLINTKYGFNENITSLETVTTDNQPTNLKSEIMLSVLYIEDNPANMRLVELILARRPNIKLLTATDPISGLEIAKTESIDLVLLDINLPAMNGFEVLKNLRNMTAYASTPVIAVSANAMPKDIEKAKHAGFNDYLTKPINVAELLEVIDKESSSLV